MEKQRWNPDHARRTRAAFDKIAGARKRLIAAGFDAEQRRPIHDEIAEAEAELRGVMDEVMGPNDG